VQVDLLLSGAMSGHVVSVQPAAQCGPSPTGFAAELQMVVGGQAYLLRMEILDYHGPDDYPVPPTRASMRKAVLGPDAGFLPAVGGDVSVGANQTSGRVQLTMGTSSKTRVQGTWACS
jgi:hypothetical protein